MWRFLVLVSVVSHTHGLPSPSLHTIHAPHGTVAGRVEGGVATFFSVPYARPPTGPMRFRPAALIDKWGDSEVHGTGVPKACIQFWIHGGGFASGAGFMYDGAHLAQRGVVVVTINYRLGVFASLSSPELRDEDPVAFPSFGGANGFTDQLVALKWVQANIHAFGGDASKLTVFGESAGGLSVCALMASPLSHGLFHNAIIQSGSCVGPWGPGTLELGLKASAEFIRSMRVETVRELREINAFEFLASPYAALVFPSVDTFVLPAAPSVTFAAGNFTRGMGDGAVMLGTTSDDGLMPAPFFIYADKVPRTESAYRPALANFFGALGPDVLDQIISLYPVTTNASQAYITINSDLCLTCPSNTLAAELGSAKVPTYLYRYGLNPAHHDLSPHTSEIGMVFGFPIPFFYFDSAISWEMQSLWSSFAVAGRPSAEGVPEWPTFDTAHGSQYLNISQRFDVLDGPVSGGRCAMWDSIAKMGQEAKMAMYTFCADQYKLA